MNHALRSAGRSSHRIRAASLAAALCGGMLTHPALANGDDNDGVKGALERARSALEAETSLAAETRRAFTSLLEALEAERVPATVHAIDAARSEILREIALETMTMQPEDESLLDRLNLSGDMRLRHESTFISGPGEDRHRQRMRFRIAGQFDVNDEVRLGARLTTGDAGDAKSSHITLGDGFESFEISFDRVYARYAPKSVEGLWVTAGKFGHPFYSNPIYGELVWDADIQPEGVAIGYGRDIDNGALKRWQVVGGVYNLLEQGGGDDAFTIAAQAMATWALNENTELTGAIGYYHYTDPTPDGAMAIFSSNLGNSLSDTNSDTILDSFTSDFGIINPIIAVRYTGGSMPVTFSAEYIYNTRAEVAGDTGWAMGVSAGQSRRKGDWQYYYQYQVVEQDAVFSPFTQDDFLLATNFRGHVIGAKHRIQDWAELHVWGLVTSPDAVTDAHAMVDPTADDWRIRLDLNLSF